MIEGEFRHDDIAVEGVADAVGLVKIGSSEEIRSEEEGQCEESHNRDEVGEVVLTIDGEIDMGIDVIVVVVGQESHCN